MPADSKLFHLKSAGIPIGIAPDSRFPSRTFQLEIDDVLVAYTDGITEAENPEGEFWGQKRLETVLRSSSHQTAEQIMQAILDKVSVFVNGQAQHDDMTLVVLQVHAGCDVGSSASD
jgi:sigma-B regulation protein RsbU (phosphoserine phosphatase)